MATSERKRQKTGELEDRTGVRMGRWRTGVRADRRTGVRALTPGPYTHNFYWEIANEPDFGTATCAPF